MKSLILPTLLIISLAGCGGEQKAPIENGVYTTYYYKGGPIRSEQPYKDGKLDGVVKNYYKNSALRSETPYVAGKIHGTVKRYSSNGQLAGEAVFQNDVQVSEKRHID